MKKILNFPLPSIPGIHGIAVPAGSLLLSVKEQQNIPVAYFICEEIMEKDNQYPFFRFEFFYTGDEITTDWPFIDTLMLDGGNKVIHIFSDGKYLGDENISMDFNNGESETTKLAVDYERLKSLTNKTELSWMHQQIKRHLEYEEKIINDLNLKPLAYALDNDKELFYSYQSAIALSCFDACCNSGYKIPDDLGEALNLGARNFLNLLIHDILK